MPSAVQLGSALDKLVVVISRLRLTVALDKLVVVDKLPVRPGHSLRDAHQRPAGAHTP
jgi:hypothetical protein